jgi:hypothetical protein
MHVVDVMSNVRHREKVSGQTLDARDVSILIIFLELFRRCTLLAVNVQERTVRHIRNVLQQL